MFRSGSAESGGVRRGPGALSLPDGMAGTGPYGCRRERRGRGRALGSVASRDREAELSKIENWISARQDKGFVAVVFVGDGSGVEVVNSFLKKFCAQELYWLAAAFASVRLRADGVFGARIGREKKAL